jgi:predicted MFS family arabinose efflux permease
MPDRSTPGPTKVPGLYYGWIVVAVTFLVLLIGAGIRATPGILILPLEREFGWSAATISSAVAINILLYGLLGPFAVAIMERFGLRRTVSIALILLGTGVAATIFMRASWQLILLWGFVVGSGTGVIAMVLGATIAERWFLRHRGLVLGLLTASSATGQLVFLPLLAWLDTHFGWRSVSMTVAAVTFALLPIVALAMRDRPSDMGLPPFGGTKVEPKIAALQNPALRALTGLRDGLRSRDFWLLSGSFFICGASTSGLIGTHLIPACGDHGIPEVRAASLLAMMGIFDFLGTTGSGWLTDRLDSRLLLFTYYALRGVSLFYLPFAFDYRLFGLPLFAVFYGLDWIATVPPTVRLAELSFGKNNAALMFGWIAAVHQIGGAFAAWGAGVIRTETTSYMGAFISAGLLCLIAAAMVIFIGGEKEREASGELSGSPSP